MSKGVILGQETDLKDIEQQINNIEKQISNVSDKFKNYLLLSGGTMTGQIDLGNNKITNLQNPSSGTDACNLQTVDSRINSALPNGSSSLSWRKLGSTSISNTASGKFTYNLSSIPFAMGVKVTGKFLEDSSRSSIYVNLNNSNADNDILIVSTQTNGLQGHSFNVSRILVPEYIGMTKSGSSVKYQYIPNSSPVVIGTNTFGFGLGYGTFTGAIAFMDCFDF